MFNTTVVSFSMTSETPLAALPVRQRGTLEIVDTAMKLYRRYFGVLMGWSALSALLLVVGSSATCGAGAVLVYPLIPGSCACAVAAAVRGQRITFAQVWDFTKPRYGALLLLTFLSFLLMSVAFFAIFLISALVTVASAWLLSSVGASDSASVGIGIIGSLLAYGIGSVLSMVAYAWLGLVPIIACLEDDKRGVVALGRAWDLMKGSWGRVLGLSTLLTVAIVAVMGIVGGALALFGQSLDVFSSGASESAFIALGLGVFGFFALFFLFWNPIQTLVLSVLYLDLRVRKEALDLEWTSYASTPAPVENSALQAAPATINPFDDSGANAAQSPAPMQPPANVAPAEVSSLEVSPAAIFAPTPTRPPAPATQPDAATDAQPVSLSKPPTSFAPETTDFSSSFSAGADSANANVPASDENAAAQNSGEQNKL